MFNLKIPCLVEEEAIATALRKHAHERMFGPEFSAGDLVRFQNMPGDMKGPCLGHLGVVADVLTEQPGYHVYFVTDGGDIRTWKVKPHQIRPEGDA